MQRVVRKKRVVPPVSGRKASAKPATPKSTKSPIKGYDLGLFDTKAHEVVVGIDQSLTAFAVMAFALDTGKAQGWLIRSKEFGAYRLDEIARSLGSLLTLLEHNGCKIQHITMEGYSHGAKFGREDAGEVAGITKLTLARHWGVEARVGFPTIVSPGQVKKFTTNNGNARKDDMKLSVFKKWDEEFRDDNLADAYALARVAAGLVDPNECLEYEKDVLQRLHRHTEYDQFFAVRSG